MHGDRKSKVLPKTLMSKIHKVMSVVGDTLYVRRHFVSSAKEITFPHKVRSVVRDVLYVCLKQSLFHIKARVISETLCMSD